MENNFEPKLDKTEKSAKEIEQSPFYKFVKDNFDLFDNLDRVGYEIHILTNEVEKDYLMMGEIDRKKKMQKMDALKIEEKIFLDKIIEKLVKSKSIKNIPNNEDLYEAFNLADKTLNDSGEMTDGEELNDDENIEDVFEDEQDDYISNISQMLQERMEEVAGDAKNNLPESRADEIKIAADNDRERLENIRKLLSSSTSESSNQDAFDPQEKLLEISKRPEQDGKPKEKSHPQESKKESLKKYKDRIGSQMLGMSKINHFLENDISKDENIDLNSLYSKFATMAEEYKLAQWQVERYKRIFAVFKEAMKESDETFDKYKNKTGVEIIEDIRGNVCIGEIKMEKHSLSLVFSIYDDADFARIISGKIPSEELSAEDYKNIQEISGVHMGKFIYIRGLLTNNHQEKIKTLEHEVRHRIHELILEGSYGSDFTDKYFTIKSSVENLSEYFINELNFALNRAKDEILAYFKNGTDISEIMHILTNASSYEFLNYSKYEKQKGENGEKDGYEDEDDTKILKKYDQDEIKQEFVKCEEKYENILSECLAILGEWESWGFPRGEIIGMFQMHDMEKWKKTFERIIKTPQFISERNRNSDEKIKLLEEDLRQYRKNNPWLKRKIDKLKTILPLGLSDRFFSESFFELELELQLKLLQAKKSVWKQKE